MKLNKARPPLIFNGFSGVFVYNQNGDGEIKLTLSRAPYYIKTRKIRGSLYK